MAIKNFFVVTFIIYCVICLLLFIFQRNFIYFPRKHIEDITNYNLKSFEEITLVTEDNHKIMGWYKKAERDNPTIVYFHGNAGS